MSLIKYKDSPYWHTRFQINGVRVSESTKSTSKSEAQRYEEKRRREIREQYMLGVKPKRSWLEAEQRWLQEMDHKKSLETDIYHFEWLAKHLGRYQLCDINKEMLEKLAIAKEKEGRKAATINRIFCLVRAVLNRAHKKWEWLERVPVFPTRHVNNARIRWLTREEASRLLGCLPSHLRAMAKFTLNTGLRAGNIMGLQWSQINMANRNIIIHGDQSKNGKAFGVPLNREAIEILKAEMGRHHEFVFTYQGHRVRQCCTKAWRKALVRAGIENFRWHDLRHTWASWHVQGGTSLQELFELGGWKSFEMVLRYAHLSSSHLQEAADRLNGGGKFAERSLKVVR